MPDKRQKIRFLADAEVELTKKVKKRIQKNLSTPESREFWAAAEETDRIIKTWPQWKQDIAKQMQDYWSSRQGRWREDD